MSNRFSVYDQGQRLLATVVDAGHRMEVEESFDPSAGAELEKWFAEGVPVSHGVELSPGEMMDEQKIVAPSDGNYWLGVVSAMDDRGWSMDLETPEDMVLAKSYRMLKSVGAMAAGPNCGTGHGGFKPGNTCGGKKKARM
jgi:hypothetical protein